MPKAGWKSNVHSYYLFRAYFSDIDLNEFDEASAREFMVKQYLASYGPVTENDIAWWTGFPKNEIKKILGGIKDLIIRLEVPDLEGSYIMLHSEKQSLESKELPKYQTVSLLPVLDPYIMGYKDRKRYLDHKYYDFVFDFNGNATTTIVLDGKVVGVWDFKGEGKPLVKIFLFEDVERNTAREIYVKAQEIGRFIGDKNVDIIEYDSMVPLTRRTAVVTCRLLMILKNKKGCSILIDFKDSPSHEVIKKVNTISIPSPLRRINTTYFLNLFKYFLN